MSAIDEFEANCRAAKVKPVDVLVRAGLHRSTWFRWKGDVSPNLRNLERAQRTLQEITERREEAA